jgi:hypothetical protein
MQDETNNDSFKANKMSGEKRGSRKQKGQNEYDS